MKQKDAVTIPVLPWYHGPLSRQDAEGLLKESNNGTFLIRESVNFPGDYTLCISHNGSVEHYRILHVNNSYTLDEEELFDTLEALVQHYSRRDDGLCCTLRSPLEKLGPLVSPGGIECFQSTGWLVEGAELTIEGSIGRGDFAEVCKASLNGSPVAAKVIKQLSGSSVLGLHEASAMTIAGIHPNLVRFIGLVSEPAAECLYLLTEFCPGGCLLNWLRTRGQAQLDQRQQLGLAINIASAVQYLQLRQLIHRDIACRNVFITGEPGIAKLGDFGMSRRVDQCERTGRLPVKWTAPEAILNSEFSFASDIWSLGVFLWELYSFGRLPYPGIGVKDVVSEVESGYRLPPPKDCPVPVYECMRRTWQLDPQQRPSADDVLMTLNREYNLLLG
ncbi:hypothetical protein BOX15_Mlig018889g2 [Macrostomum lignano]|uniref:Tyrosine-protein kinase n=1 Tax=Macrostomum lignano TaxID=282301 RepID=A0A267GDU5_9PLAT|nr:hypothetical protein BOX15_Mlig018889g3 [Macrostomum lignano]PAA84208.1 hypothetical protein BOX15_Mlig018889g2 [Macrostomum lignano]